MTTLRFEGKAFEVLAHETVLECLERNSIRVPTFCRAGVCQSCMLVARQGVVPAAAQRGLKDAWKEQGCFLSCVCRPTENLEVERSVELAAFTSRVARVERVLPDVLRVELSVPEGFVYRPGQFIQLERPGDRLMRPYSLASLPGAEHLELHVRALPGGQMSGWLASAVGSEILLRGPLGECHYRSGEQERPLLLAGTGTGLAPLLGVVRAALAAGHRGAIRLYHGSTAPHGLYLWKELADLAAISPNLTVIGSVLTSPDPLPPTANGDRCGVRVQALDSVVLGDVPRFADHRVYLCGDPDVVHRLRRGIYLAGGALERIHSDPFLPPAER